MVSAGIDIGSRTIKLITVCGDIIVNRRIAENSFDPLAVCENLLKDIEYEKIVVTGYGRHLFKDNHDCEVISEIMAVSLGAKAALSSCRTILDIGGQDIKTVSLDENGRMRKFEMNDKCSAGTGRFMEIMAMALGCGIKEFGQLALTADKSEKINSTCTVFAESEVISMLARGAKRENIAMGLHETIIAKAKSMLWRVSVKDDFVFVGGGALNLCTINILKKTIGINVCVPKDPQTIAAYGCALHGINNFEIGQ